MAGNATTRQIYRLMRAAATARDAGDGAAAIQAWVRCIQLDDGTDAGLGGAPNLPPIRLRPYIDYAEHLRNHGDAAQAIEILEAALVRWPDVALAHTLLGMCLRDRKDWECALAVLQHSCELRPSADVCVLLADTLCRLHRRDDARWWLFRGTTIDPDHEESHFNLGCEYERIGDVDAAIEHVRRATELDPDYALAHAHAGLLLYRRALHRRSETQDHVDWGRAIEHLRRATQLDPADGWSYAYLAVVYEAVDRPDDAEPCHQAATRLLPGASILWSHYGYFRSDRGDHAEAERMLRHAVDLDPDNHHVHSWLGKHLWRTGDHAGARAELLLAHRLGHRTALAWLRERDTAHRYDDAGPLA